MKNKPALIFDFDDYKLFLLSMLDGSSAMTKGGRSRLSKAMGCQTAYLSQVLNGKAHLSFEQGDAANQFFKLGETESEFFLLLLQRSRAGTASLRRFIDAQIEKLRASASHFDAKAKVAEKISAEQWKQYYSKWQYTAIHALTTQTEFQTVRAIAEKLQLKLDEVAEALGFLAECGLVLKKGRNFVATTIRIPLNDPAFSAAYHIHWRLQSIRAIAKGGSANFHASLTRMLTAQDLTVIRSELEAITSKLNARTPQKDETELYCLGIDWFALPT